MQKVLRIMATVVSKETTVVVVTFRWKSSCVLLESYLDMVWYWVSLGYVETLFVYMLDLIDLALPDKEIFD
jgi:hypothetical protein